MIRKILVANRGEIACRIMRTCARLGIQTVAVYSEADVNAPHVQQADEAIYIGAAPSVESYLKQERILQAAKLSGADAIHPGYGFLSENANFAFACEQAGLIFIGPSVHAIERMGSKKVAKEVAINHNVPVVPGYQGDNQSTENLTTEGKKVGFPLLVKAASGGGGKGMRVVFHESELYDAIESAKRESLAAFGDDTILLERYFETVRHIEIQVFGDNHGNLVYLYERECSIQRRHQKIIEEAPSSAFVHYPELRQAMGEAALRIARAIGYSNAGTVEFILTPDNQFFFLEVNTRLQVEHPVTEAITGLDLVEWQILVAEGKELPLRQSEITLKGAAVEVRLYAESPENQFLPCTGIIHRWHTSPYIRVETGVAAGSEISIYYDPMIAKIIAWGEDRPAAHRVMSHALAETVILGLKTNLSFLKRLIEHPEYLSGNLSTGFIQNHVISLLPPEKATLPVEIQAAAVWCTILNDRASQANIPGMPAAWRNNPYGETTRAFSWESNGSEYNQAIQYQLIANSQLHLLANGLVVPITILTDSPEKIRFVLESRQYSFTYYIQDNKLGLHNVTLGEFELTIVPRFTTHEEDISAGGYRSPMPGKILQVLVTEGQNVQQGESLLVMESMKMENTIRAHTKGVVKSIFVSSGMVVAANTQLIEIE